MFKKILVALDHSTSSEQLLQEACSLAQQHQANLMLLHVLSSDEAGSPIPIPFGAEDMYFDPGSVFNIDAWSQQWQDYAKECMEKLRHLQNKAQSLGIDADIRQIPGTPGRVICDFAQSWEADLIMIGNRGHSGVKELFLGSVSNYVLHHAGCNVLTMKTLSKPL